MWRIYTHTFIRLLVPPACRATWRILVVRQVETTSDANAFFFAQWSLALRFCSNNWCSLIEIVMDINKTRSINWFILTCCNKNFNNIRNLYLNVVAVVIFGGGGGGVECTTLGILHTRFVALSRNYLKSHSVVLCLTSGVFCVACWMLRCGVTSVFLGVCNSDFRPDGLSIDPYTDFRYEKV